MFNPLDVKVGDRLRRTHPHSSGTWTFNRQYEVVNDVPGREGILAIITNRGEPSSVRGLLKTRFELLQEGPW